MKRYPLQELLVCVVVFSQCLAAVQGLYPDCNFTSGLDGWENNNVLTWIPINHALKNDHGILTGRQGDNDSYGVINYNSSYYHKYYTATMVSHYITGPVCMKFFFYLHGGATGFLKISTGRNYEKTVFRRYGNHGQQWNFGQVYLDYRSTDVYRIAISGEVGNTSLRSSPAIDDISFENRPCKQIPQDKAFNCSFVNSRCGWTTSGLFWFDFFEQEVNRYVTFAFPGYSNDILRLKSPHIPGYQSRCFSFQYRARSFFHNSKMGRLFVFVADGKKEMMPVWDRDLLYGSAWRTVEIKLNFTTGFTRIIFDIVFQSRLFFAEICFANFALYSEIGKCRSVEERTFFASTSLSQPTKYVISPDGVSCDSYQPASSFTAGVVPSGIFTKPIYIYSPYSYARSTYQRSRGLAGYFYVAKDHHTDTSPVYYSSGSTSKGSRYFEILTFGSKPPVNTTHEVFYVKNYQNWDVNHHCLPGWFEITGKCLKLVCGKKWWQEAQDECSKTFAALVSLNDTSLPLVTQYFKRIQISLTGYKTVSVGSTRADRQWWRDDDAFNKSLDLLPSKARLAWDRTSGKWKIEQSDSYNDLYLCEKQRANIAFRSPTNQSRTRSHYSSDLAVDGISSTCSVAQKASQPSWWQVTLAFEIKIYFIRLSSSSSIKKEASLYVNADRLFGNNTSTCEKIVGLAKRASTVICEPPVNGRYVKIEAKRGSLKICEVEVYGTESLKDLRGVSRAFWRDIRGNGMIKLTDNKNYPSHPDFYHVISAFDPPKNVDDFYGQVLEAYFMPQKSGNYTFILSGGEDVEFYIYSGRETNSPPLLTTILAYYGNAYDWNRYPKHRSPPQFLYAYQFYFLKVLMKETYGSDHVSLGIQYANASYEKTLTGKNLFWILPGELQVEFSLNRNTITDVTIGQAFSITGTYVSHCLGMYCGDCPLAVFLTFKKYFKCILLSSQSDAQNGHLSLDLKTWFLPSASYEIVAGYQTNGNCSIITNTVDLDFEGNVNFSVIGSVFVKPIILVSCQFNTPKFCVNVDHVRNDGWRRIKPSNDNNRYSIGGVVNKTASFSFNWVENEFTALTGICVKFQYKISGENNSLSLSFQTFSGKAHDLWSLRGYHGDQWHKGFVGFPSNEALKFVFEAHVVNPNSTVAIADVIVTTQTCLIDVNPLYAEPGHQCGNGQFRCANGQCIANHFICDGDNNCLDRSDEKICQCLTIQFKCKHSRECISKKLFCDGDKNCEDGSDEENCYTSCTPEEEYNCPSGQCLPWSSTCNGVWDCLDGADEPDICSLSWGEERSNTTCSLNDLNCAAHYVGDNSFCGYATADCDFEEDLCAWRQLGSPDRDNFDWSVNSGETSSKGTGPRVDHTTNSDTGKYIFIEASLPRVRGDVAILEAGPFERGKNTCITFYYHMFGKDIGSLDIYKVSMNESELLWTRNGSETVHSWHKAWFNVVSNNDYVISIQATCGNDALGDIAIDDISMFNKNCSEVNDSISPFCSFEKTCDWERNNGTWRRHEVNGSNHFILQNHYIYTTQSSYLSTIIKESLAETYQCMSFWYKYFVCPGMLLVSSQTIDGRKLQLSFKLSDEPNEKWRIAEMPLRRSLKEYMVRLDVTIPSGSSSECYLGLDEINFSVEPCLSFQQGGPVWIRKSSKFYKVLKKLNKDGTITAFYNPPSAPGFLTTMKTKSINSIVRDIAAVNYSKIPLGARVFVESGSDYDAVIGTVIKNETIKSHRNLKTRYRLTIRLDSDGKDLVIETQKVWLLPYQLRRHDTLWRDTLVNWGACVNNGFCYKLLKNQNWYNGVDYCKELGGDIASFKSRTVENMVINRFSNYLPFWIGYHGHKNAGYQFEWSDGSKVVYHRMHPSNLTQGLSAGLCTVVEKRAWIRRNCSEKFNVVCKRPGVRRKIICRNQILKCTDPGTALFIYTASLRKETPKVTRCSSSSGSFAPCPLLASSKTKVNVYNEVQYKCHKKFRCSLSANYMSSDPCRKSRKYLEVTYSCLVTTTDISKDNSVLCPEGWVSFRSSCYQFNNMTSQWLSASMFCVSKKGAPLVTLNDEQEEEFVKTSLKVMGQPRQFWITLSDAKYRRWDSGVPPFGYSGFCVKVTDKGWDSSSCTDDANSVCEYSPALGSCDFEANWCGWWAKHSNKNESHWERKFIQRNNLSGGKSYYLTNWWRNKASERAAVIYVSGGVINLRAQGKDLSKLTVCLWLYPYSNNTEATVINFGNVAGLRIFFKNNSNFMIDMQEWNTTTSASVSFETWQHICFSIDTTSSMWSFYKDGTLTDIGLSNVFGKVSKVIYLRGEIHCTFYGCFSSRQFFGKITKPNMWSKVLNTRRVAMVSTGCGVVSSGDITIWQTLLTALQTVLITASDDECVPGKGLRLVYRKDNLSSSDSTSTLVSPWMKSSRGVIQGVCVMFVYRLLGQFSEIKLSVEPKHMNEEVLWKVKNTKRSALWKWGQVYLGLSSEFRVRISAKLIANNSAVNIDNVFFKEGFCDPIPRQAQEWKTNIYNSSSGFLTSPYYPSYYLNNMRREWEIKVPVSQRIKLNFLFLNLEAGGCEQDSVVFQDGGSSQQDKTYCGNILPPEFISQSNIANIIFTSGARSVRTGFKIHYEAVDATFYDNQCDNSDVSNCPVNINCYYLNSNKTKVFLAVKSELFHIPPRLPESISGIDFDGNYLTKLSYSNFENMTDLEYLSLRRNQIADIEKETFFHSRSLQTLCLAQNYIQRIPDSLFNETRSLKVLDLSMNAITKLQSWLFLSANNIRVLSLRRNKLESFDYGAFSGLYKLQYLYLDENRLSRIDSEVFKGLGSLKALILKDNKLRVLKASWLRGMTHLQILNFHNNALTEIEPGAFNDLKQLTELDLSKNHIENIPESLFKPLDSLRSLKVDHYTLCCYAKQSRPSVSCFSQDQDGFSSCDELLKNIVLKYSIWVLGVMAFAGNLVVIVWRIIAKDSNRVNSFLLTNLAVADFLMGVYMLIIAYKDTVWRGVYFKHDISWRASNLCIFAGIVSIISSEVSVFTLSVITFDRLICIVFPFRCRRFSMKKATTIMFFVWLLGSALAFAPLFNNDYFHDYNRNVHFFGRSAVCLPLQLSSDRPAGWQYSVFIFIFLNGLAFLFILLAYIVMYHSIIKAANAVRSTRMNQDSTLAKRMMFIIMTDFFCWFPVIIISILSLTGNLHDPRKEVYAWIAVFVLPINSSINPLLYTFSTPFVRKRINPANPFLALSLAARTMRKDALRRKGRSSSFVTNSFRSNFDSTSTIGTPMSSPQSLRKLEVINEAFTSGEEENAESSFIECTTPEYCVKFVENVEMFGTELISKKSFVALEETNEEEEELLCVVDVYKNKDEDFWRNTTKILSWLCLDDDHDNILPFLWSARASKVLIKNQKFLSTSKIELEPDDCLICYELPSKQSLQDFLDKNNFILTEDAVYAIIKDLIQAIDYLTLKKIAHNAILPCNIVITESLQSQVITAILGGLSCASFVTSSHEDNDDEQLTNDVESFGNILKILLETFPVSEQHAMLHDIMVSCLNQDRENRPTTSELCEMIELMDVAQIARDVIL